MKPKERPGMGASTTAGELIRSTSTQQKWNSESFKVAFLILYFASLFCSSSGAYPDMPKFVVQNNWCGKYIHPRAYPTVPNDDPLHLWDSVHFNMIYQFVQYDGKWGFIRHVNSGKYWVANARSPKKGTRIVLHSTKYWQSLFYIDQVNGFIKSYYGLYIHFKDKSCDRADPIHLWDSIHHRMRWRFVNPDRTSEKVLPYGSFKTSGYWSLLFAVHNPLAAHHYEVSHKEGRSQSRSISNTFTYEWQVGASAKKWFFEVSTSVTLSQQIQHVRSSAWHEETTKTHNINVLKGQSVAVWQKMIKGEQLGNQEVFQTNFFAHTASRYEQPPNNHRRTAMNTLQNSVARVYYYYANDTDSIDVNLNDNRELKTYNYQDKVSIFLSNKTDNSEDGERIFILKESEQDDNVDIESDEQQVLEYIMRDGSISRNNDTEDIDYDEDEVFSLYDYVIVDDNDDAEQDDIQED